jgi:hypothetical protein
MGYRLRLPHPMTLVRIPLLLLGGIAFFIMTAVLWQVWLSAITPDRTLIAKGFELVDVDGAWVIARDGGMIVPRDIAKQSITHGLIVTSGQGRKWFVGRLNHADYVALKLDQNEDVMFEMVDEAALQEFFARERISDPGTLMLIDDFVRRFNKAHR